MQSATPRSPEDAAPETTSTLVSRNVTVGGHRTSIRLEPFMWSSLFEICRRERMSQHQLCTLIAERKDEATSLTSAIRVFLVAYNRAASTEEGHIRARHGGGQPFHATPFSESDEDVKPTTNGRRPSAAQDYR